MVFGIGGHGCLFCHTIATAFEHTKFYIYVIWYILYAYNIHTYIVRKTWDGSAEVDVENYPGLPRENGGEMSENLSWNEIQCP